MPDRPVHARRVMHGMDGHPPAEFAYTREELIAICEAAIVPMEHWSNRDSSSAQEQVGQAWALLRAGAPFTLRTHDPATDERTIWVDIERKGFCYFEVDGPLEMDLFYLPTRARLEDRSGRDWY